MLISLFICWFIFLNHTSKALQREKSSDKAVVLRRNFTTVLISGVIIIGAVTVILAFIPSMHEYDISVTNREYVPVDLKELKVMYLGNDSDLYLEDGYGNIYCIPKETLKKIEVFEDGDKLTSVEKVTEQASVPKLAKIVIDFGLFTSNYDVITEYYELSVPASKLVQPTPISEADFHSIFEMKAR